ncbi:MAG: hypothetical protein ACYCS1_07890 [Gammaproteobacteria bacterium]
MNKKISVRVDASALAALPGDSDSDRVRRSILDHALISRGESQMLAELRELRVLVDELFKLWE